jgi:hydrophobic/amphiphilic exporter-1 (mainly G- bacteria), HAE1 family
VRGGNVGRIIVRLKPAADREQSADEVIQELRRAARAVEGMELVLHNPPAIRIGSITGAGEFQVVLRCSDLTSLYPVAQAIEARLEALPMIQDVSSSLELANPEIQVHILRERAASLGVSPQEIETVLGSAFGGSETSKIYGANDQYPVFIQLDPALRRDVNALDTLYVQSRMGRLVPLASIAAIRQGVGPISIEHFGQLPSVTLSSTWRRTNPSGRGFRPSRG